MVSGFYFCSNGTVDVGKIILFPVHASVGGTIFIQNEFGEKPNTMTQTIALL